MTICAGGPAAAAAKSGLLGDPARVARTAVRGMLRGRALVLPGAGAKLMAAGSALTPQWLIRLIRCHTDYLATPGRPVTPPGGAMAPPGGDVQ